MTRVCANCVEEVPVLPVQWRGKTVYCCVACRKHVTYAEAHGGYPGMGKAPGTRPMGLGRATESAPTLEALDRADGQVAFDGRTGLLRLGRWK